MPVTGANQRGKTDATKSMCEGHTAPSVPRVCAAAVGLFVTAAVLVACSSDRDTKPREGAPTKPNPPTSSALIPDAFRSTVGSQKTLGLGYDVSCVVDSGFVLCAGPHPFSTQRDDEQPIRTYLARVGHLPRGEHLGGIPIDPTQLQPGDVIEHSDAELDVVVAELTPGNSPLLVSDATGHVAPDRDGGAGIRLSPDERGEVGGSPSAPQLVNGWKVWRTSAGATVFTDKGAQPTLTVDPSPH